MNILTPEQMPHVLMLPLDDADEQRDWKFLKDWYLDCVPLKIEFFIAKGRVVNFANVPGFFEVPTGYFALGSIIHDEEYRLQGYYRVVKWENDVPLIEFVKISRRQADDHFEEIANWLYPKKWFKTGMADIALGIGGQAAWDVCRKADGTYIELIEEEYEYKGGGYNADWKPSTR